MVLELAPVHPVQPTGLIAITGLLCFVCSNVLVHVLLFINFANYAPGDHTGHAPGGIIIFSETICPILGTISFHILTME